MKKILLYTVLAIPLFFITVAWLQETTAPGDCEDRYCSRLAWGAIEEINVPFSHNSVAPPCTVKVYVQKRLCKGVTEMKVVAINSNGCTIDNSPGGSITDILGRIWNENDYFGILPDSVNSGTKTVRIYSSSCWAELLINAWPSAITMYLPCEKSCCVMTVSVWKNPCDGYDGEEFASELGGYPPDGIWCNASEKDVDGRYFKGRFIERIKERKVSWHSNTDADTSIYNFKIPLQLTDSIDVADTNHFEILKGCQFNCLNTPGRRFLKNGEFYNK